MDRRPAGRATAGPGHGNPQPFRHACDGGLTVRRARIPGSLATSTVSVPFRTTRRGLRPGDYDTVGVVPESGTARFTVPVDLAAKHYRLTVAVGQRDRRLRVHRIYVPAPLLAAPRSRKTAEA